MMNRVTFSSAKSGAILPNGILPPTHNSGNISKLLCWVNPPRTPQVVVRPRLLALIFNPITVRLSEYNFKKAKAGRFVVQVIMQH